MRDVLLYRYRYDVSWLRFGAEMTVIYYLLRMYVTYI